MGVHEPRYVKEMVVQEVGGTVVTVIRQDEAVGKMATVLLRASTEQVCSGLGLGFAEVRVGSRSAHAYGHLLVTNITFRPPSAPVRHCVPDWMGAGCVRSLSSPTKLEGSLKVLTQTTPVGNTGDRCWRIWSARSTTA